MLKFLDGNSNGNGIDALTVAIAFFAKKKQATMK